MKSSEFGTSVIDYIHCRDYKSRIEYIKSRLCTTGYISMSLKEELDKLSGMDGFTDKLLEVSTEIVKFFESIDETYMDDILFGYFDTYYNFSFSYGVCVGDAKKVIVLGSDKFNNVISGLLDLLYDETLNSHKRYIDSRQSYYDKHSKFNSYKNLKPSKSSVTNYFKLIVNANPILNVSVKHRNSKEYWDGGWGGFNGITRSDMSHIPKLLKNRLSHFYIKFGGFKPYKIDFNYYTSYFVETNTIDYGQNILIESDLTIKFNQTL